MVPTTRIENGQLVIDGYRNAVKLVDLDGYGGKNRKVRHVGDLGKHRIDLARVVEATDWLIQHPDDPPVVRRALWQSAVVTFARCFTTRSNARQMSLEAGKVFPDALARQIHRYIEDLRDKDIAHDDALVTDTKVCAVVGPDTPTDKVIEILFLNLSSDQLSDPTAVPNLHRLAQDALRWVTNELERRCGLLVDELRQLPYEQVTALPDVTMQPKQYPHPTVGTP
ncbi:hypothetical protein A9X06_03205 [Mycobacterium sp. 852002-51759_SCH5129042]|nr:hypothetical protein A9X06_03205 [Mycobacterium sp. 852002-51759_SCH5129042]